MDIEKGKQLVDKVMQVILSCKTLPQLNNAVIYASFAYKKISKEIGLVNSTKCIYLFERSIGYAHCKIITNSKK